MHPVEANELFVRCTAAERDTLRARGFGFYDWGADAARFVTAWNTRDEDARALADYVEKNLAGELATMDPAELAMVRCASAQSDLA